MSGGRSFREDLERFVRDPGSFGRRDCLFVCDTPASLVMLGMRQLPMFITQSHVRDIMHPKDPGNRHWHGLGAEQLLAVPELLGSPAIICDSLSTASRQDAVIAVLAETDEDFLPLIAAIRPNGASRYECEVVRSNHMLSVYGREGLDAFLDQARLEGRVLFVDEEKTKDLESQAQLELLRGLRGLPLNGIIHPSRVTSADKGGAFAYESREPAVSSGPPVADTWEDVCEILGRERAEALADGIWDGGLPDFWFRPSRGVTTFYADELLDHRREMPEAFVSDEAVREVAGRFADLGEGDRGEGAYDDMRRRVVERADSLWTFENGDDSLWSHLHLQAREALSGAVGEALDDAGALPGAGLDDALADEVEASIGRVGIEVDYREEDAMAGRALVVPLALADRADLESDDLSRLSSQLSDAVRSYVAAGGGLAADSWWDGPDEGRLAAWARLDVPAEAGGALGALLASQGHTLAQVADPGFHSPFVDSLRDEAAEAGLLEDERPWPQLAPVVVVETNVADWCRLMDDLAEGGTARVDNSLLPGGGRTGDAYRAIACGLWDGTQGAGGPFDVQLERPVDVDARIVRDLSPIGMGRCGERAYDVEGFSPGDECMRPFSRWERDPEARRASAEGEVPGAMTPRELWRAYAELGESGFDRPPFREVPIDLAREGDERARSGRADENAAR